MFTLFKTAKSTHITFTGINVTLHAIEMNVLQTRFLPVEIYGISQNILSALETYTLHEQAMVTSFLETYFKVVKLVAQHQWSVHKANAIKTLKSRTTQIDVGYMQNFIRVNTFTICWHNTTSGLERMEKQLDATHISWTQSMVN